MSRQLFQSISMAILIVAAGASAFAQTKSTNAPKTASASKSPAVTGLTLGRLASEKSIFFLTSNGWKTPDAKSTNKTERLWSEKSVQEFIRKLSDEVQNAIVQTIEKQAHGDDSASKAASTIPVLLGAVIAHPIAISLTSFTTAATPEINFSMVIDAESDADKVRDAFNKLVKLAPKEGPSSFTVETIEGAEFFSPQIPEPESPLKPRFGMYKSYLIFALGPNTVAETIKRISGTGKAPAWLDATLNDLKVDRPLMAWHLNVEAIWKTVDSLIEDPKIRAALDVSGLFALKRIAAVSGLDAVGSVDKIVIETTGQPKGLLSLLPDKPLAAGDLKGIPANPAQAIIVRFDLANLVESILKIADEIDPQPRQQFEMASAQGEQILGFSIKDDLLQAFGDVWSTYVSGGEAAGGLIPSFVVAVSVKDQEKLTKIQDALVDLAEQSLQQLGPQAPVTLSEISEGGGEGYQIQISNLPLPIAPSWIITKDRFVFGLSQKQVADHFEGAAGKTSLANNEDVKAALKRDPKTVMISYRDPKLEIPGLFTVIGMGSPYLTALLQQQGIDFTVPPLPPFSDLEPHLAPSVATFTRTPNGWRSESHGVVPSVSSATPAVAAVGIALLLPAVGQAREAARRTQSKNNLKQIGLAMHNYHDAFQHFPERVVLDKDGNPGLSWRVKILPYLDQTPLYNEFHLDEPWDSEHNKKLIERMPTVFASPTNPEQVTEGKTSYLVLDGAGTLFDGEEGPGIAQVTDGTSNTIMAVEARSENAVIWTKPDDLEVDFEDPLDGLEGARTGGFHVLLADGSVRFISDFIDVNTLKALFTRAGGEVIGGF